MMASRVIPPFEISHLRLWSLRSKLGLAPPNRSYVDGTYNGVIRRIRNRDRKMVKDPRDNRRKNEFITGHCIPIDINDRSNEIKREINGEIL